MSVNDMACTNCRREIRESEQRYNSLLRKYCCERCVGDVVYKHIEKELEYVEPLLADLDEVLDEEAVYDSYMERFVEEVN